MPPKRKYKQWLRDGNVPIPKRTLVRLKKSAASNYCTIRDESLLAEDRTITEQSELNQDITWEISGNCEAILNDQTVQTPTREVPTQTSLISCDNELSEDEIEAPNRIQCDDVSLTDLCHLQEDCDYRDILIPTRLHIGANQKVKILISKKTVTIPMPRNNFIQVLL